LILVFGSRARNRNINWGNRSEWHALGRDFVGCLFCRRCAGAGRGRPPKGLTFLVCQTEHRFTSSRWIAAITSFLLVAFQNLPTGNFARHRLERWRASRGESACVLPRGCHWCSGFKGSEDAECPGWPRTPDHWDDRGKTDASRSVAMQVQSILILYLSLTCRKNGTSTAEPAKPKP
jgi:hypothetical protein